MLSVRDMLMDLYKSNKNMEQQCRQLRKAYEPPYRTEDQYIAGSHEYWRGMEKAHRDTADRVMEIIKEIDDLLKEDMASLEAYEQYLKELKGDWI